jgi:hypothetical protein
MEEENKKEEKGKKEKEEEEKVVWHQNVDSKIKLHKWCGLR